MSISVSKIINLPQAALKFLVQDEIQDEPRREFKTLGGVFSDADYAWLSRGPRLEVVHTKTGNKVGAWTFGWVLRDFNTEVVCVGEIQRPHGRLPLLAVGIDCDFSGGMVCIFDFVTSKVIRAIHVKDKITSLHVIDAGYDIFTLPGPLRNFDGIIAVGTAGGDVFLIDICRQICDEALTTGGLTEIRDELNPCQLSNITLKDIPKIEFHKEFAVRNSHHLAIHLNIVFDKSTKHFTLKGPKGDDRIHVNKDEVTVSALYYCPQLGSLLIGYNFGALQLYNLMNLDLVYTSPVCDEHIPISQFTIQEPADDPRAFCYVWAVYSASEQCATCLPLAVMYAFCYHTKEYHEGYGFLYQDFNTAAVHYQMELGIPEDHKKLTKPRGGYCLQLNSINQGPVNREGPHHDSNEDNLTLCILVWNVCYKSKETDTFLTVFDLNQWYKEQMPNVPDVKYCSTYMIQMGLSKLIGSATNKSMPVLDIHIDKNSLQQFTGAQRLEEHFCPSSICFGMNCLRENDIIFLYNYGVQKALLAQIESSGPLCLVEPAEIYQEIIAQGLVPLFIDLPANTPISTNQQREIILGTALENQLMGWLCKCASEWANGSFLSTGCSLDLLISWAFQRATALKTNCDNFCVTLFDYSEVRLDNNTNALLNNCTRQLKNVCSVYAFIIRKLSMFISNLELVEEQYKSLQMVSVYFEVLQWLLNVGLLPECPLTAYPRSDDLERINAPYPAEMLINFYDHRRALLKILNEENFSSSASVLFIDTLINRECGGEMLQEHWRSDGGNGLYPPPSLQALLRTYLIDNVELSYKHSVIIYVFLDLAMTLDQDRYKPVITHLIKFPAVFKVSPSLIKITQAFWQLDHGDYNTAMGLLLDPLILTDDLNHWHHKVALRSLLLQKQHNFALLYVQVRKPALREDEDILTAISLYVANNMLDEAFYFEKHFTSQPNGEKFLSHLFNECKKNDKIRSIIYRSLTSADENYFLKYLLHSKQSSAEDLHVYYHILRSHFIEAFESHDRTVPNQIESQGLVGQENAVPRDKLVYSLKKLLPGVNRNLLNLCHKEKNNVWHQVSRPTPMSVFVHNLTENVQYKSTLIGAALAKAKQTFNETVSDEYKLETEGTPFLRTPQVCAASKRSSTVVINPKIIDVNQEIDDFSSPPSAKRMKLSPRSGNASFSALVPSKLDTPVVKRKLSKAHSSSEETRKVATPHSILKVKNLINQTPSKDQFDDDFKAFEKLEYTPVSSVDKKSGLRLSPRKSLNKASPVVRFEGLKSSSSSFNNSRDLSGITEKSSSVNISPNAQRLSGSSKNTSTEEEIFYSPDTSFEDAPTAAEVDAAATAPIVENHELIDNDVTEIKETPENSKEKLPSSPVFSPKARKSYKRSLDPASPVRSSPRLSKVTESKETAISSPKKTVPNKLNDEKSTFSPKKVSVDQQVSIANYEESISSPKENSVVSSIASPRKGSGESSEQESLSSSSEIANASTILPKLRPRKSLCRKVLETNALNRVLKSPFESPRSRRSKKLEISQEHREETVKIEEKEKTLLESTLKYTDGEETHKSSFVKTHNVTTTSLLDSDLDTSDDFSIDYDAADEPKLSVSMIHYINNSANKSILQNSTIIKETVEKEINDAEMSKDKNQTYQEKSVESLQVTINEDENVTFGETLQKNVSETLQVPTNKDKSVIFDEISQAKNVADAETLQDTINTDESEIPQTKNVADGETLRVTSVSVDDQQQVKTVANDEKAQNKSIADGETHNKSVMFDLSGTSLQDKSVAYSEFESSLELFNNSCKATGPKFSESMLRCINNRDFNEESVDQTQTEDSDDEIMEIDDSAVICEELNEENKIETTQKDDDLIYEDLINSNLKPLDKEEGKIELVYGDLSDTKQDKEEEKEESFYGESSIKRPVDPEMNVFELSDDLSVYDGLMIEKEVTLEENDLCYDQQNTLESVMEENMRAVSSTPLNVFEKNVFNESSLSQEEDSDEDEDEESFENVIEDGQKPKVVEDDVIEIGSSSDEPERNNGELSEYDSEDSQYDDSDEENLEVSYERNIYDSDMSSDSSYERHQSEISENSDDSKYDQTEAGGGLFRTAIVVLDEQEDESNEDIEELSQTRDVEDKVADSPILSDVQLPTKINDGVEDKPGENKEDQKCNQTRIECSDTVVVAEQKVKEQSHNKDIIEKPVEAGIFIEEESFMEEDADIKDDGKDSENDDGQKCDQTQAECGLFYGDIILEEEREEKEANNEREDVKPHDKDVEKSAEVKIDSEQQSFMRMDEDIEDKCAKITENVDDQTQPKDGDITLNKEPEETELNNEAKEEPSQTTDDIEKRIGDKTPSEEKSSAKMDVDIEDENKETMEERSAIKDALDEENVREKQSLSNMNVGEKSADHLIKEIKEQREDIEKTSMSLQDDSEKNIVIEEVAEKAPLEKNFKKVDELKDEVRVKRKLYENECNTQGKVSVANKSKEAAEKEDSSPNLKIKVYNEKTCPEDELQENCNLRDPLDSIIPSNATLKKPEIDILDSLVRDSDQVNKIPRESVVNITESKTRSSSLSTPASAKPVKKSRKKKSEDNEETSTPRRSTRRSSLALDSLDRLEIKAVTPKKIANDVIDELSTTRILRSRAVSTEDNSPVVSLRKRSASVDEAKLAPKKQLSKREVEVEANKERSRRAASVVLPKISEEDDTVKEVKAKKSRSVLDNYSMTRRVTRQQLNLLKNTMVTGDEFKKHDLEDWDPTVLLDRPAFEGTPDPEEKKIYETSPSTTNSTSSSPAKPVRRLRSASQVSETSERAKSTTPVRTVKGRQRKISTDEISDVSAKSNKSASKRKIKEVKEETEQNVTSSEPRTTRSRAKSVSSLHSEDSNASETQKVGKGRNRLTAQSILPKIAEESNQTEISTIPKKRTRKNSSQH